MEITTFQEGFGGLFWASLLLFVSFFVARRVGFFSLPPVKVHASITVLKTVGVFLLYLLAAFVFPAQTLPWGQLYLLLFVLIALIVYCFCVGKEARSSIFWGRGERSWRRLWKSVAMGAVTWVVSYPFVFFVGILTSLISLVIWNEAKVNQLAVEQLKMVKERPLLFSIMIVFVVLFVPLMEEILFRGFLHNLLKRFLGRVWGLIGTAVIFALVHFAPSQGRGNFQLIVSLFVLSLFLGFIYEREETLWAPIALHATFNGFTVLLIVLF